MPSEASRECTALRIYHFYTVPSFLQTTPFPYSSALLTLGRSSLRLRLPIIMRHLKSRPPEPALDVESLVRLGAIQNTLVAPNLLSNKVQRLNYAQPKLLPLLILRNRNILNVPDEAQVVNELALDDEGAGADDSGRGVEDGKEEVLVVMLGEPLVALVPLLTGV